MTITLRNTKGSALTHSELDGNFTDLDTRVLALAGAYTSGSQVGAALDTLLGGTAWRTGAMTGAQIVTALDTVLGSTNWQLGGGGSTTIVNDLTTGGTTSALSAQQGVVLNTAIGTKANTASPALTGTPTAPTATAGTNTTQIATTAFVAAVGAALAPLASPTFTGTPAAPTAAGGTNTTQIATTAFVTSAVAPKADIATTTESVATTTYTLTQADNGKQKLFTNASGVTITVGAGLTNFGVVLTRANGAGDLTIQGNVSPAVTIRGTAGNGPHVVSTANASVTLLPSPTANEFYISGPVGSAAVVPGIASQAEAEAGTENTKIMSALRVKQSITANASAGGSTLPYGWNTGFFNDLEFISSSMHGLTQTALAAGSINGPFPANLITGRDGVGRVDGASGQTNTGVILRSSPIRVRTGLEFVGGVYFDPTLVPAGTTATNVGGRFGWAGNITAAAATYGIGFEKIGHTITAFVRNAGLGQNNNSTGNYVVAAAGFFHFYAQATDSTHVRFRIYADGNATAVFDETITTSANLNGLMDSEDLYPQIGAWTGGTAVTGAVTAIANFDYIGWGNANKLPGRPF